MQVCSLKMWYVLEFYRASVTQYICGFAHASLIDIPQYIYIYIISISLDKDKLEKVPLIAARLCQIVSNFMFNRGCMLLVD